MNFERLRMLYTQAALFVFPSLYEGFGLPPLEAAACGTPVVCSNRGALPEIMGDAAIFVDPEDTDELACAIRRVITSPELRRQLTAKGRLRASLFTWQRTVATTEAFYREILKCPDNTPQRGEDENRLHIG
ncbi:MAG: glycosyltransferase [Kiritimatiellae bacterium]|nr:glycosyltransferase [Kiritimatiellia bacterium]